MPSRKEAITVGQGLAKPATKLAPIRMARLRGNEGCTSASGSGYVSSSRAHESAPETGMAEEAKQIQPENTALH